MALRPGELAAIRRRNANLNRSRGIAPMLQRDVSIARGGGDARAASVAAALADRRSAEQAQTYSLSAMLLYDYKLGVERRTKLVQAVASLSLNSSITNWASVLEDLVRLLSELDSTDTDTFGFYCMKAGVLDLMKEKTEKPKVDKAVYNLALERQLWLYLKGSLLSLAKFVSDSKSSLDKNVLLKDALMVFEPQDKRVNLFRSLAIVLACAPKLVSCLSEEYRHAENFESQDSKGFAALVLSAFQTIRDNAEQEGLKAVVHALGGY